jgi:hypothetical protein
MLNERLISLHVGAAAVTTPWLSVATLTGRHRGTGRAEDSPARTQRAGHYGRRPLGARRSRLRIARNRSSGTPSHPGTRGSRAPANGELTGRSETSKGRTADPCRLGDCETCCRQGTDVVSRAVGRGALTDS